MPTIYDIDSSVTALKATPTGAGYALMDGNGKELVANLKADDRLRLPQNHRVATIDLGALPMDFEHNGTEADGSPLKDELFIENNGRRFRLTGNHLSLVKGGATLALPAEKLAGQSSAIQLADRFLGEPLVGLGLETYDKDGAIDGAYRLYNGATLTVTPPGRSASLTLTGDKSLIPDAQEALGAMRATLLQPEPEGKTTPTATPAPAHTPIPATVDLSFFSENLWTGNGNTTNHNGRAGAKYAEWRENAGTTTPTKGAVNVSEGNLSNLSPGGLPQNDPGRTVTPTPAPFKR